MHAFKVSVFLERAAHAREGLVQRIGGNGADGTAEHVALYQTHNTQHLVACQTALLVVVIHIQQEGVGDIHFQFAQVMEGLLQRGIAFSAQGHGAIVRSIGVNVRHQVARVAFEATRKRLERHVDFAHVGNLTSLGRQVVAHESVKVHNISSLAKGPFHRAPVGFVQISL